MSEIKYLGSVNFGDKVVMSDPCYDRDGGVVVKDILPGNYLCLVGREDRDKRNAFVIALHENFYRPNMESHWDNPADILESFRLQGFSYKRAGDIGVDSGQAGIYDYDEFINHEKEREYNNPEHWYRQVCETTEDGKARAGLINGKGVTSSSGWGDGCYDSYIIYLPNPLIHTIQRCAFLIDFGMFDEYDENYDDDYDEEEEE